MSDKTRVLLVEDDPDVARGLRRALSDQGYDVVWESTGSAAVAHARSSPPHMVILDVSLPDGFDFCRQMRESLMRQPILMLTARRQDSDKVLGLEVGADDYMTKPYSLSELLARVRALIRRAYGELSAADPDVIEAGDLVIDRGRAQVRRGDRPLNVTPTEFRMLVYLAQNAGRVLSRAQILDAVWGYDADLESEQTVTVNIRRLRQKVEANPGRPTLILTVPGGGYRLAG